MLNSSTSRSTSVFSADRRMKPRREKRPRLARVAFSRTLRRNPTPLPRRSSGTNARPASTAAFGERIEACDPLIRISPAAFSRPKKRSDDILCARPNEASQPNDFAPADREREVTELSRRGQSLDGQNRLTELDAPLRKKLLDVARNH